MTTYNDLTAHGRWLLDIRFKNELKDYKKSSIWWAKRGDDGSPRMFRYFQGFIKFRRAVLDGGDLITCLQDWVGCHEPINSRAFAGVRNVPQLGFSDAIEQAIRELEAYKALP